MDFSKEPSYFKLANQKKRDPAYTIDDGRTESYIRITDSVFENLAYQQELTVLSNIQTGTSTCGNGIEAWFGCIFEAYDGRGFVLNTKNFPGAI